MAIILSEISLGRSRLRHIKRFAKKLIVGQKTDGKTANISDRLIVLIFLASRKLAGGGEAKLKSAGK